MRIFHLLEQIDAFTKRSVSSLLTARRREGSLLTAVLVVLLGINATISAQTDEESPRPNVVVILADDLGWHDVGYHDSKIKTPNIDRLAKTGVRLSQHYVYSTCSPTRAALLSGQNPARFGIYGPLGSDTDLKPEDMKLTSGLQESGYSTHISGKWHLGETPEHRPLKYGFDSSYGYLRGQIDPYTHRYKRGNHVTWHRNDHFIEEAGHVTNLITDEAVRVIENAAEVRKEPFFLYVAHHSPHTPLNEPPKWIEPYRDTFDDRFRRHYAAAVTHMDHGIGRILEALERTGQRENTMVIFTSDNGATDSWGYAKNQYNGRYARHTSLGNNDPLRGWKASLYEGAIRVPAVVNWPSALKDKKKVEAPTHILDIAPTLLNLAGVEDLPDELDGRNLWPSLKGTGASESLSSRRLYWRQGGLRAVRRGPWKLIDKGLQLYNLDKDPYETNDVSEKREDKVQQLKKDLSSWPW